MRGRYVKETDQVESEMREEEKRKGCRLADVGDVATGLRERGGSNHAAIKE